FDSINYIIIIVISFIYILNKSTSGAVALSAGLMSSVAILFHEAFLLIGLPLVLAMLFLGAPPGRSVPVFVTFLIPVLMAVGALPLVPSAPLKLLQTVSLAHNVRLPLAVSRFDLTV